MKLRVLSFIATAIPVFAETPGSLSQDRWNNLPKSPSVYTLREQGISKRLPDASAIATAAETAANTGERFGVRLRGTVTPPVTGAYTFFISGDDGTELLLSPDAMPFGKLREAWSCVYTAPRQWDKFPTQRSRTLRLIAGQSYYLEALVAEDGGADHLSLGWSYESDGLLTPVAIGSPVAQTWAETSPGGWQASVDAGDIWNGSDCFSFNCRDWSGDGEFTVRVTSMNNPHAWAKAGIMVRASLSADSAHAMMVRSSAKGMSFQRRRVDAASSVATTVTPSCEWVRLVRKGDRITSYTSSDGEIWTQIGTDTSPGLPADIKVGLVATDTSPNGTAPLDVNFEDVDFKSLSAREVIPASQLASHILPADDADGDSLPDSWETAHNLSADPSTGAIGDNGELGDPDGDGISNFREFHLGTDPQAQEELASCLTRERWHNLTGNTVASLTAARSRFLREPDFRDWPPSASETEVGDNYGTRFRGFISPPASGSYTFWISGDDEAELWLADGSVKHPLTAQSLANRYGKRKIAWIHDDRFGKSYTSLSDFDRFATQRSRSITLQAGQLYYIEVLHKDGGGADHCAVAWQPPGQPREFIPASAFTADIPEADDPDDDCLPTDWETRASTGMPPHALDPSDNGWTSAADGQYGDPDQDGLTNLEEFQLGTHPRLADTDDDGWSDKDERDRYHTNPLVSNAIQPGSLTTISLATATATSVPWDILPDGSAIAHERRGWTDYPVTVSPGEEGIYELILTGGAAGGSVRSTEKLPISFQLDGNLLGSQTMTCLIGQNTSLRQLTSWLSAGGHTIRVDNHNVRAGCHLRINSLTIQRLGGPAAEGGTIPLWVLERLQAENQLTRFPSASRTSPVCIEGVSPWNVSIATASSPASVQSGPDNIFYSDIPLDPVAATELTINMQNGAMVLPHAIAWTPTNILEEGDIPIILRKGDSLLLTSHQGATASGTFSLTLSTDPALKTPVAASFTGHLPTAAATAPVAWPAADPRLIGAATGTMQGGWIPTATAATAHHISSDTTGATFQLQFKDATYTKAAKVRIENTPAGLSAYQIYARYKSGDWIGHDFDTLAGTASAPAGSGGYGVTALSIRLRYGLPVANLLLTPDGGQPADQLLPVPFDVPGNHTLAAVWTPDGGTATPARILNVIAKSAEFGPDFSVQTYNRRIWTPTELAGVDLQPSSTLSWAESTEPGASARSFTVSAYDPGPHAVLARIPETGDIVARGTVNAFSVAKVGETADAQLVLIRPDGSRVYRLTIVAENLPSNAEVRLNTYFQGAVFSDGSRELVLRSSDFSSNGVADILIEWPDDTPHRICHTVRTFLVD
ncbi:MAG: hypothetical protein H7A48_06945 [Akkermansiaceae bacterium]|nr:hypothetical protein [Akkermansiaceae bacterium]MCP5547943.1 hypothetical protein [Akkermansiaceae bacterium]